MRRIAIYGKGGIGKSTTSANITAALTDEGLRVLQIGCDPKSDSTRLLLNGKRQTTVLDAMRSGDGIELSDVIHEGYGGCFCVECGGPRPGTGCAGRGIIAAFEFLESKDVIKELRPDVIIYDVLGDVVCGGFAMPIRNGYAKDVFVVTSGEMMSLYAANNIAEAVKGFSDSGYARFSGLIQNSRNVANEDSLIDAAASEIGTDVIFRLRRDPVVQTCEGKDMTVVEGDPGSDMASDYRRLAEVIMSRSDDVEGGMRL